MKRRFKSRLEKKRFWEALIAGLVGLISLLALAGVFVRALILDGLL